MIYKFQPVVGEKALCSMVVRSNGPLADKFRVEDLDRKVHISLLPLHLCRKRIGQNADLIDFAKLWTEGSGMTGLWLSSGLVREDQTLTDYLTVFIKFLFKGHPSNIYYLLAYPLSKQAALWILIQYEHNIRETHSKTGRQWVSIFSL